MKNFLKISMLGLALLGATELYAGQTVGGKVYYDVLMIRNDTNQPIVIKGITYAPGRTAEVKTAGQNGEVSVKAGDTNFSLLFETGDAPIESWDPGSYNASDIIAGITKDQGFSLNS